MTLLYFIGESTIVMISLCDYSIDYEKDLEEFRTKSLEEATEMECPLMYISSPSAKDSSYEERYPGNVSDIRVLLINYSNCA